MAQSAAVLPGPPSSQRELCANDIFMPAISLMHVEVFMTTPAFGAYGSGGGGGGASGGDGGSEGADGGARGDGGGGDGVVPLLNVTIVSMSMVTSNTVEIARMMRAPVTRLRAERFSNTGFAKGCALNSPKRAASKRWPSGFNQLACSTTSGIHVSSHHNNSSWSYFRLVDALRRARPWPKFVQTIMLLRDIYLEAAVVIACIVATEQVVQHFSNAFSRAELLHLTIGCSKGAALLLIMLLLATQVFAVVALLVPKIYHLLGAVAPSAVLVAAFWVDAALFGDSRETIVFWRSMIISTALALIAMFRFDRRARNAQLQVPTSSQLLAVEKRFRDACTLICTGVYCPVVSACLVIWSITCNHFWTKHGLIYEYHRERWLFSMSLASLFAIQAALDTRRSKFWWLRAEIERRAHIVFPDHMDKLLGTGLGLKKQI